MGKKRNKNRFEEGVEKDQKYTVVPLKTIVEAIVEGSESIPEENSHLEAEAVEEIVEKEISEEIVEEVKEERADVPHVEEKVILEEKKEVIDPRNCDHSEEICAHKGFIRDARQIPHFYRIHRCVKCGRERREQLN